MSAAAQSGTILAMRLHRICLTALAGLLLSSSAFAWGRDGHRIVGEIAWHYLAPDAELEVKRLLKAGRFDCLGEAGNWADANARLFETYDDRTHHHYIDVAPEADAVDMARDCPEEGCIILAIRDLQEALRDRSKPKWKRVESFYFLVHFIEDIHQPLHVIHPDMTGGNETPVRFFGSPAKLHRVWDSHMIDRRLQGFKGKARARPWEAGPWKQWAYELRFQIEPAEAATWRQDLDPEAWANEAIAPSRELTFEVESGQELGEEYYAAAMPFVEQQLQKAAIRLAAVLNELFAGE